MGENPAHNPALQDTSLVVPGRNCARTLAACLRSASELLRSGLVAELIFVDDGSQDDSSALALKHGATVLQAGGRGAGAARNVGWRAAKTTLVWFVDSDCVIEPDALTRLLSRRTSLGVGVVGGSYANLHPDSRTARLIHEEMVYRHQRMGQRTSFAITANLLCEREVLQRLNGFDEALLLAQDLDFAYRVCAEGSRLGFEASSRVGHHHETNLLGYLIKQARQGYWRMRLYRKHPRRVTGDSYSGWLDYAQPPLALLSFGVTVLAVAGIVFGSPEWASWLAWVAITALGAVVVLQLPLALRLTALSLPDRAAYLGFGTLRALARGLGMAAGVGYLLGGSVFARRHSTT
jgi:GT2 family glycosyltransferase